MYKSISCMRNDNWTSFFQQRFWQPYIYIYGYFCKNKSKNFITPCQYIIGLCIFKLSQNRYDYIITHNVCSGGSGAICFLGLNLRLSKCKMWKCCHAPGRNRPLISCQYSWAYQHIVQANQLLNVLRKTNCG